MFFLLSLFSLIIAINNCLSKNGRCGNVTTGHLCVFDGPGLHHCECAGNLASSTGDGKNCLAFGPWLEYMNPCRYLPACFLDRPEL
jgi:hypothetical protein